MDKSKLFIPISIIVAGLIIGGTIVYVNKTEKAPAQSAAQQQQQAPKPEITVRPVDSEDHILGNPDAEVVIVEYSDFECPYCASFNPSMERIMDEYGAQGKVAWVYRHFPLTRIHPRAQATAEASECVANLGGNDAFWAFSKKVFEARQAAITAQDAAKAEAAISAASLKKYADESGLDGDKLADYDACVSESRFSGEVTEDYEDGLAIAQADSNFGTPYSVVLKDGKVVSSIAGAQPYTMVKQIIDAALAK